MSVRQFFYDKVWKMEKQLPEKTSVESTSFLGSEQRYPVAEVSLGMLRKIFLREPLTYKAILKKNKDIVRNWFEIKPDDNADKIDDIDLKIIKRFDKRVNFPYKIFMGGVSANVYGTGFCERTFIGEKNPDLTTPAPENNEPLGLPLYNAENITEVKKKDNEEKSSTVYYVFKKNSAENQLIHPSRIIPFIYDSLPFNKYFGSSVISVLANVLKSKMNADISSGEIINWFGRGVLDMTINNMNPEQHNKMLQDFKKHPSYYVHDEAYKLEVKNPTQIDPAPFYDYFYTNISSVMQMPKNILTGESIGNVSGSEVGISDYYHDLENIQNIILTPIIEKIYTQLLESQGRTWKYKIHWRPIFIDEISEAKILQLRTYSATSAKQTGIIDDAEARRILNDGVVYLDPNKKIEKDIPVEKPADEPNVQPQVPKDVKKPTVKQNLHKPVFVPYLSPLQKDLIEKEKLRGEIELIEQEERLKEAERIINEKKEIKRKSSTAKTMAKNKKGK